MFCNVSFDEENDAEELLNISCQILEKHSKDNHYQHHQLSLHFLYFEYYKQIKQFKKATVHFDKVNSNLKSFFLLSSCCFVSKFLFSKIEWYVIHNKQGFLESEMCDLEIQKDENDKLSNYAISYHIAVAKMLNQKNKEAGSVLNNIINTFGFKDYLHSELEVKLLIAYLYVIQNEYEMASNNIRSIYRKIKSIDDDSYENALVFCKLLNIIMNDEKGIRLTQKVDKTIKLFEFENNNSTKPLLHFIFQEMKKNLNS